MDVQILIRIYRVPELFDTPKWAIRIRFFLSYDNL